MSFPRMSLAFLSFAEIRRAIALWGGRRAAREPRAIRLMDGDVVAVGAALAPGQPIVRQILAAGGVVCVLCSDHSVALAEEHVRLELEVVR